LSTPSTTYALEDDSTGGDIEEKLVRRELSVFAGARGYRPTFLGRNVSLPLPSMSRDVRNDRAPLKDGTFELKYDAYTAVMSTTRRTAIFVASNVDGRYLWKNVKDTKRPPRPSWTFDPRMDDAYQPDDSIFSTALQRGHLFKREDAHWGKDDEALRRADFQSFTITNATPMIANFNNVEWGDLEDLLTRHLESGKKLSQFSGPIFSRGDPYVNELRRGVPPARKHKGMRIPLSFWKIVAWVDEDGAHSAGFILTQREELDEQGRLPEIDFGRYRPVSIKTIEDRTELKFPELKRIERPR
jgi:endonuclease G